jgi:hypothetical protein
MAQSLRTAAAAKRALTVWEAVCGVEIAVTVIDPLASTF